ncbi:hypothetical protein [Bradyrhizobium sp. 33ap4]|uniref:hypothetical protein n=1 Tax=Bradyrhizobium sp. 33ap4 TaxID=3061630 RepID=UPI002931B558|nr:hypothetical protein [Bradyrhizobium sp. 33ap4]
MEKSLASWFFLRPTITTFQLEPEQHPEFIFGTRERAQRDHLLGEIEGASYGDAGFKAVVFGDYGRGKTRMCQNLRFEIQRHQLRIFPIYVKCSSFTSKAPFHSLFREMIMRHSTADMTRIATEYGRLVAAGTARPLIEIVQSEDIALVMGQGLALLNAEMVRRCMRWLSGEGKVPMEGIGPAIKPQLSDSSEFGAVMRGLSHMIAAVDRKVVVYFIDEAERFNNITNADAFTVWLVSLRELTEIAGIGLIFFVGAISRNELPVLLLQEEIMRRIGVVNYIEFLNPSRDELRAFVKELFSTCIRKGEVPEPHKLIAPQEVLDPNIPDELATITQNDEARLDAFPFEPDALDEFIEDVAAGGSANKPSEVLKRLLKATQRAIRKDRRTIDRSIVAEINAEGM